MLRTSCSWGADKMDVLALVRVDECQPIASDDFLDVLWRTAKDELALVLSCAGNVGYTQHGGKPQQPDENPSFHFALHLMSPSHASHLQDQLAGPSFEWLMESHQHSHCPSSGMASLRPDRALSCLWPYGLAERHLNLLAGLAYRHVESHAFGRRILRSIRIKLRVIVLADRGRLANPLIIGIRGQ